MSLTQSQEHALSVMNSGVNVFLTGGAGVGKSYLLKRFIEQQRAYGKTVLVTASTGVAANNVHGTTFHSALGVSTELDDEKVFTRSGFRSLSKEKQKVILNTDILIVDEISMLRCDAFDCGMNKLTKLPDGKARPQIILCGDFFQLPPVIVTDKNSGRDDRKILKMIYGSRKIEDGFAFEGIYWDKFGFVTCELTEIVRQADPEFAENLNKCRIGDPSCLEWFEAHAAPAEQKNAPSLYGTKKLVDSANTKFLYSLPGELFRFKAELTGKAKASTSTAPLELSVKIGAKAMLLINSTALGEDATCAFQNGSIGTIEKIDQDAMKISVRLDETGELAELDRFTWTETEARLVNEDETGKKLKKPLIKYVESGEFKQFPLALAYAVTVHKSQGQTYDAANVAPGNLWADGQLYVALSRSKDIRKLHLYRSSDGIEKHFRTSEAVQRFYGVTAATTVKTVKGTSLAEQKSAPAPQKNDALPVTSLSTDTTPVLERQAIPQSDGATALDLDPEMAELLKLYRKAPAVEQGKLRNLMKAMLRKYRAA